MREFINHLIERGYKKRAVGFIENGSWAPVATKVMKKYLEEAKELTFAEHEVKILSAPDEKTYSELDALAAEIAEILTIK